MRALRENISGFGPIARLFSLYRTGAATEDSGLKGDSEKVSRRPAVGMEVGRKADDTRGGGEGNVAAA